MRGEGAWGWVDTESILLIGLPPAPDSCLSLNKGTEEYTTLLFHSRREAKNKVYQEVKLATHEGSSGRQGGMDKSTSVIFIVLFSVITAQKETKISKVMKT